MYKIHVKLKSRTVGVITIAVPTSILVAAYVRNEN